LAEALVPDRHVPDVEMLSLAAALDGHPDNVAACLVGGLVLVWTESAATKAVRLQVDERIAPLLFCADRPMSTSVARGLLPQSVPHSTAAANSARVGLLVTALTAQPGLLLAGTADLLHQEARRRAYPDSMRLVDLLRERSVAAVISGAGPSVLALCTEDQIGSVAVEAPAGWTPLRLSVDRLGARILPG
jgi:homoserine kinase